MKYIVYKATHRFNGKSYIGISRKTLHQRKTSHWRSVCKGSQTNFHKELRKVSLKGFKWRIIKKCNNVQILKESEIKYIAEHNSFENGYNMTKGGEYYDPKNKKNNYQHELTIKKADIIFLIKFYDGNVNKIYEHLFPYFRNSINKWLIKLIKNIK